MIGEKKYGRVCIVDTVQTLFLYLLISSEEEVLSTFFFVSEGIPAPIRQHLSHYFIPRKKRNRFFKALFLIRLRLIAPFRWRFLNQAELYGHDHLTYSSAIISNRKITVIEDGFINYISQTKKHKKTDVFGRFLFGGSFMRPFGDHNLTKKIILTKDLVTPFLEGKELCVISIQNLYQDAPQGKKDLILKIFNISREELNLLKQRDKILFTQAFEADQIITEEEKIVLYRNILKKYNQEEVIIKTHPREKTNYKELFPDVLVFDKIVPSELLLVMGLNIKKAITICSTAVASLSCDIDWYGTSIHPSIFKKYGEINLEDFRKKI